MFLPSSCSDRNVTYTTESYLFRAKETNCMWRHFQTFDVAGWRGSGYITTSGVKAKERIWEVLENYLETISFRKNTFGKNYFKKNQGKWKVCMGVHPINITNLLGYRTLSVMKKLSEEKWVIDQTWALAPATGTPSTWALLPSTHQRPFLAQVGHTNLVTSVVVLCYRHRTFRIFVELSTMRFVFGFSIVIISFDEVKRPSAEPSL